MDAGLDLDRSQEEWIDRVIHRLTDDYDMGRWDELEGSLSKVAWMAERFGRIEICFVAQALIVELARTSRRSDTAVSPTIQSLFERLSARLMHLRWALRE